MTREDMAEIIERCDERYVKREDCDTDMSSLEKKLHNDDKRLALIEHQLKINNWLIKTVLTAVIAELVVMVVRLVTGG